VTDPITNALGSFSTPNVSKSARHSESSSGRLCREGDALFRRETLNFSPLSFVNASVHSDSWQFPVMLKYRGGHSVIAPVFGAGVTVRHTNDFNNVPSFLFNGLNGRRGSANTVGSSPAAACASGWARSMSLRASLYSLELQQLSQAVSTILPSVRTKLRSW